MSQKLTETEIPSTISMNFQISIRTEGDFEMLECFKDFYELVRDWGEQVQITSATAALHDGRKYEEVFTMSDKEEDEKSI